MKFALGSSPNHTPTKSRGPIRKSYRITPAHLYARKSPQTLRATSHMSQEPWPCNGEDPWLSSKGRTMGVGKAVLCSHGPSSIVWSENGPYCGTIAYFVGEKRGEDLVYYNMSQTLSKRITWWWLYVMESALQSILKSKLLEFWKKVMVSHNLR